jgi:hypothetical protein
LVFVVNDHMSKQPGIECTRPKPPVGGAMAKEQPTTIEIAKKSHEGGAYPARA